MAGAAILLFDIFFVVASPEGRLTPQERRGKQIYLKGSSPSGGAIKAIIGDSSTEVPAATLPCAGCHGTDGRGRSEGGVIPSDITWKQLTKLNGITHASGRKHQAYTDRSMERAITDGLDPAGSPLAVAMPRYSISRKDLDDLIAYLKRVGEDRDPGLTESSIRLGTILPAKGPLAEIGQAMKAVMTAYFDEINAQGGIYHRKIELRVAEPADTAAATRENARRLIEEEEVFALVGALIAGADQEMASLIQGEEVPLVGPFTLFPEGSFLLNRYLFYVFSGLKEQGRALADFAARKLRIQAPRAALVFPETKIPLDLVEAIEEQCKKSGWSPVDRIPYSPGRLEASQLVERLSRGGTNAVFFLGSWEEGKAWMNEAARRNWTPHVFLPGSLVGKEIFDLSLSFQDKIYLAYPTLPSDQTPAGVIEYRALLEKHRLSTRHLAAQISAYCAAKILLEGLKLAGKELSREKLVVALEGLYELDTGLSPRITYGPNRRIGALGAHIVAIDLQKREFIPAGEWIGLD